MTYYPTIEGDLARAREIIEKGRPSSVGLPEGITATGGTIFVDDIYTAYKLLESFVAEIERLRAQCAHHDDRVDALLYYLEAADFLDD